MSRPLEAKPQLVELVVRAEGVARQAHAGQVDKQGKPYIDHCGRVAYRVHSLQEQIVAWLHDVVEDTPVTLDDLHYEFPDWVVEAVDAITHRGGVIESRETYYERIRGNDIARAVKIADIADNLDPRRLLRLPAGDMVRLMQKYAKALDHLEMR